MAGFYPLVLSGTALRELQSGDVAIPGSASQAISTTSTFTFGGTDQIIELTLTNAIVLTFGAPTGIVKNAMYKFILKAGDVSQRTFAWNTAFKFPGAVPKLSSGSIVVGAADIITFIGDSANTLLYDGHCSEVR